MSHEIIENQHLAKQFIQQVGDPQAVISAVEKCLDIYPPGSIKIKLSATDDGVSGDYRAYYSRSTGIISLSVEVRWFRSTLQEVFAHEVAHYKLDRHFGFNMVPYTMHEREAQYVTANYRRYM